jgi:hypothetical protein
MGAVLAREPFGLVVLNVAGVGRYLTRGAVLPVYWIGSVFFFF